MTPDLISELENSLVKRQDLLIGLDAGTSTTRAVAFTPDGKPIAEGAVPVTLLHPEPGWVEQPAESLVESACEVLRAVARQIDPSRIAAIGITGQMGGLVLVDVDGQAVSPHLSWLDGRAAAEIDRVMATDGHRLLELGGLTPYLAPKAAWWRSQRPALFDRAHRMLMPAGYIMLRLADLDAGGAVVDRSSSGFVGLFDVPRAEVSPALCELWDVPASFAPRVVRAGEVVGRLSLSVARETGLPEGVPLVAAPGDGPAGWLGAGAVDPGLTVDTAGTSDHIGICGDLYAPDTKGQVLICLPSAIDGLWHLQGYTSGTGLTHRWYLETFPLPGGIGEAERLAALLPPGSEDLVCIAHFGGRTCPYDPAVSGVWLGLTWRHRNEHLYRALLESVAYEYACYVKAARRLDPAYTPSEVRVIGGGAASRLWTQVKADVLGVPFALMEETNYTCWGAALAAGAGVGIFDDLGSAARSAARIRELVEPEPSATETYQGLVEIYAGLYASLAGAFDALWQRRQESSQRAGL